MIKKLFNATKNYIIKHKKLSIVLILVIFGLVYWAYSSSTSNQGPTRYVLAAAAKGTIISSVSGTGQVSASSQMVLSPGSGASGKIVYLNAASGQKVRAGTLLLELDTTSAQKTIRDAQSSLISAQIALQKLAGVDNLTVPLNKQNAIDALNQDYQSGYNTVSSIFTDLPTVMINLQNIIYGNTFNTSQQNIYYYTDAVYTHDPTVKQFADSLTKSYQIASTEYTKNFNDYKLTTRYSDNATIDSIISETYNTTRDIAQAVKDANNLIQFYKDTFSKYNIKTSAAADTHLATANADATKMNSDLISLLSVQNTLKNDKVAVDNSDLDVQSQQLSFAKSQNTLQDAKDALANYYIYAPFSGVVGAVSVQKGDTISSGTSAITFITQTETTSISVSEIDITKINLKNKAILTFDAIDGLSIVGQVTGMDTIGTVSQGVVSYNVKITFETQDNRVKPGMSVNANIITNTAQNVLTVPNSAVKTKNGSNYVLVLGQKQDLTSLAANQGFTSVTAPTQKTVQIGVSDSTNTEIISGLVEGDQVVSRTISGTKNVSATPSSAAGRTTTGRPTQSLFIGGGGPPGR